MIPCDQEFIEDFDNGLTLANTTHFEVDQQLALTLDYLAVSQPSSGRVGNLMYHVNQLLEGQSLLRSVTALLALYLAPETSPVDFYELSSQVLQNLQRGLSSLDSQTRFEYFHDLANALPKKPETHHKVLIALLLNTLASPLDLKKLEQRSTAPKLSKLASTHLYRLFLKVILLPGDLDQYTADRLASYYPGLSAGEMDLITHGGQAPWVRNRDALQNIKTNVLRHLQYAPNLTPDDRPETLSFIRSYQLPAFIAGSCDQILTSVESLGTDLKRNPEDWDCTDGLLIQGLIDLYYVIQHPSFIRGNDRFRIDQGSEQGFIRFYTLHYLRRSVRATEWFSRLVHIAMDASCFGAALSDTYEAGEKLIRSLIVNGDLARVEAAAPELLMGLLEVIRDTDWDLEEEDAEDVRYEAYPTLGMLLETVPTVIRGHLNIVAYLFNELDTPYPTLQKSVTAALRSLAIVLTDMDDWASPYDLATMEHVLRANVHNYSSHTASDCQNVAIRRYYALYLAQVVFRQTDPIYQGMASVLVTDLEPTVQLLAQEMLADG